MKNNLRTYNPVVKACASYMPSGLYRNKVADLGSKHQKDAGASSSSTCVYNPTVKGYGGYVQHESREFQSSGNRKRKRSDIKETRKLVNELLSQLASGRNVKTATVMAVKRNPILRKNSKLMKKVRDGLVKEDIKYLKNLARSM